jgi:hypothetical protein
VCLAGVNQQPLLLLVMLTIWVYLVHELDWVKVLRIKHISLALEGRLQRHSSGAAWLSSTSLHCIPALRHVAYCPWAS